MVTSRTLPASTSVSNVEKVISDDVVRCVGFWNSVNNANSNRTMITQRAKLRRLAFIWRPSWPPDPPTVTLYAGNSWRLHVHPPDCNVGGRYRPAKGTRGNQDHLTGVPARHSGLVGPR